MPRKCKSCNATTTSSRVFCSYCEMVTAHMQRMVVTKEGFKVIREHMYNADNLLFEEKVNAIKACIEKHKLLKPDVPRYVKGVPLTNDNVFYITPLDRFVIAVEEEKMNNKIFQEVSILSDYHQGELCTIWVFGIKSDLYVNDEERGQPEEEED